MKSKETIKKLADTDKAFVGMITVRYNIRQEAKELRSAAATLKKLGLPVSAEIDKALNLYHKKDVSTERALDEIYGWVWQDDEKAFEVCGLV